MSNNKSSVELLIEQLEEIGDLRDCTSLGIIQLNIDKNEYLALKDQAKAMHKEEIKNSWGNGWANGDVDIDYYESVQEKYYNETFK